MQNALYDSGRQKFLEGSIAYLNDAIKVVLVGPGYSPNLSEDKFYSSIIPYISAPPQLLKSKTSTAGVANAAPVIFPSVALGKTIKYIVIYKDTGDSTESPLIGIINDADNLPMVSTGGNVNINWDSGPSKIFKL
jgi:hypothetical protein